MLCCKATVHHFYEHFNTPSHERKVPEGSTQHTYRCVRILCHDFDGCNACGGATAPHNAVQDLCLAAHHMPCHVLCIYAHYICKEYVFKDENCLRFGKMLSYLNMRWPHAFLQCLLDLSCRQRHQGNGLTRLGAEQLFHTTGMPF